MMPKRISAADTTPFRVVIVTLDDHLAGVVARAEAKLRPVLPNLTLSLHSAAQWGEDSAALERCRADIARGDIVIVTMMFMEDHINAVLPALAARREACDAMVVCMSSGEVAKLTRMGRFTTHSSGGGLRDFVKRMRGKTEKSGVAGAQQMKMLRRIPKILKFVPGTAQDLRAYLLTLQYWLAGSDENIANLVAFLVNRYAEGPRKHLRGTLAVSDPAEYPEVGVYHPRLAARLAGEAAALAPLRGKAKASNGTVGVLVMRSYLLAKNTRHYDGVIAALEAKGLEVVPAFASGLDARPAIEQFFMRDGKPTIDALVSLTGFSLIGGPAYNDAKAAEELLASLDVPYVAAHPVEFQTLEQWGASERGLMPVEATIMVAIPELDGATGPMVFGGRSDAAGKACPGCSRACVFSMTDAARDMHSCAERAEALASRVARQVALRRTALAERKLAIVLFNFPPNAGSVGTAAFLSVFESLWNTLNGLKDAGYRVDLPHSVEALRHEIVCGNSAQFGTHANMHTRIPADDHVRRERYLAEIEAQWGPAPGRQQADGSGIFVLGKQLGNVFIGLQPAFGYEGDPMRLLFEKSFAPTHAFSAFYRYLREDFGADAVLHFGTHGALEFMPGKQTGLSGADWPDRLLGNMPNLYLYASNNPSEGTIAKRRSAATLISYLTSPVAQAGLYRGLLDLKASLDAWRQAAPEACERAALVSTIQAQAAAVDLAVAEPAWGNAAEAEIAGLTAAILELEYTLIPHGLHVVGAPHSKDQRIDMLETVAEGTFNAKPGREALAALVDGVPAETVFNLVETEMDATPSGSKRTIEMLRELTKTDRLLAEDHEVPAILRAIDGRYLRPAPGGDLLRTPDVLPTGRNLNGFDPFRIPSAFAVRDGEKQAARLIARHMADGNAFPQSIALVLWGTDNLKSQGGPIAQALALIGARPRFDSYGRLAGAELIPLAELGRPRIDVVMTLSGIFRDLLPLQTRLLAEASFLAASVDEPEDQNFIRRNALTYAAANGCDIETASLRVFGNADGAYGANVNHLVEASRWDGEDELAETYSRRKCYAYGRNGRPVKQPDLLKSVLSGIDLAYQNLESVELGVTTLDQYFDTLGGISRSAKRARGDGADIKVYIGDQTRSEGLVRTLDEQVALETRTRVLNPKWYEGMLKHGYEGVRHIESHVTNTMGWSATTGQVAPWIYQQITETYVLDETMRERLATLNPTSAAKVANRLIEAHERKYWSPSPETLAALQEASEALEDRIEGVGLEVAA